MFRILASRLTVYLFCTFCIIQLTGCADDLRNRKIFDSGAGEAMIRFFVEDLNLTRDGESADIESVIDHAYLLFYTSDASLITDIPLAAVKADIDSELPGRLKFKMPLSLQPNTDYQLLAIANADLYTPAGYESFDKYLESWCKNYSSEKSPLHLSCSSSISPATKANLPMHGGIDGGTSFRFSEENGVYSVPSSLTFRRMVARIDVANIVKEGFKVEGIALCNWRDGVPVASFDSQPGNSFGAVQGSLSKPEDTFGDDRFVEMPDANDDGIQQLSKKIYCFPSVSHEAFPGDKVSTAIIIKANYGEDSESSYYRVNVGTSANLSKINPNTKYLVTIRSVKGRGAATPQEAYFADGSQIVLSVVEGWDLEGNAFDMDDNGNFIVLSKGSLVFAGDATEREDIRILTSKSLQWSAEYIADDEISASAFEISNVSGTAVAISPKGVNEESVPLTGKCRISASTSQGGHLKVDISLRQEVYEEKPYEPVIPENLPFALIPVNGERVKIDHDAKTIEIDGFDPDCFNSFIDIPFQVYINENISSKGPYQVYTDLSWPIEGQISNTKHNGQYYCLESFGNTQSNKFSVYSKTDAKLIPYNDAHSENIKVINGDIVYISVGAMGPDDPMIQKSVTIINNSGNFEKVIYNLILKPCPVIIDDVILTDNNRNNWLVVDRNIQNVSSSEINADKVGRRSDGSKWQAYNYLSLSYQVQIPNKYFDAYNTTFDESKHSLYRGLSYRGLNGNTSSSRVDWLNKLIYLDNQERTSPFYEADNIEQWIYPTQNILQICAKNIRVSKLRMYLVSEIPAKLGRHTIPVSCYWPFHGTIIGDTNIDTYGYYSSENLVAPESLMLIYCDRTEIKTYIPSSGTQKNYTCLSRLVRQISHDELEEYKQNYLGYGADLKLSICHPDTYGSEDWLPY